MTDEWITGPVSADAVTIKKISADTERVMIGDQDLGDVRTYFDKLAEQYAAAHQKDIDYKFNEDKLILELHNYIDKTYGQHYSQNKFQATEFIFDGGHGVGFCVGNMMKYTQRYGHKGTPEDWRKDVMKVLHYGIMLLHVHDQMHKDKN